MYDLIEAERSPDTETVSFFVPVEKSLAKAKDGEEAIRWIQGLSSTPNWDQQQEKMLQEGIDFQPLRRSGYINWNHEKGPANLIGEPTETGLQETKRGYGLFLKGFIYTNHGVADKAWETMQAIDAARAAGHGNRQMGWSVEGGITGRDPSNPRIITKATIRHMALTHEPVNADTYAEVAKSFGQDWVGADSAFDPARNRHFAFSDFTSFAKSMASGAGVTSPTNLGVAMGDASVLVDGSPRVPRFFGKDCKGKCKKNGYRPRHKSLAHLIDCEGLEEETAFELIKSMIECFE